MEGPIPDPLEGYISAGNQSVARDGLEGERGVAFALLKALVAENYAANRRSYGASLKSELGRRTFDGFDERRLQFGSFGRFLKAGEAAGVISLHAPPKGRTSKQHLPARRPSRRWSPKRSPLSRPS